MFITISQGRVLLPSLSTTPVDGAPESLTQRAEINLTHLKLLNLCCTLTVMDTYKKQLFYCSRFGFWWPVVVEQIQYIMIFLSPNVGTIAHVSCTRTQFVTVRISLVHFLNLCDLIKPLLYPLTIYAHFAVWPKQSIKHWKTSRKTFQTLVSFHIWVHWNDS